MKWRGPDLSEPRGLTGRRAGARATVMVAVLLTEGALHVAQPILVPIALAILLAFVLGPVVGSLERRVGRLAAVVLIIVSLWTVVGVVAWAVTRQIASFASRDKSATELQATMDELLAEIRPGTDSPPPIVVQGAAGSPISLAGVTTLLGSAGLTTLLLAFMLLERQELRNRLIRLVGSGRLAMTTKAMDELDPEAQVA